MFFMVFLRALTFGESPNPSKNPEKRPPTIDIKKYSEFNYVKLIFSNIIILKTIICINNSEK